MNPVLRMFHRFPGWKNRYGYGEDYVVVQPLRPLGSCLVSGARAVPFVALALFIRTGRITHTESRAQGNTDGGSLNVLAYHP